MSCIELMPLCSVPKIATPSGMTGATAYLNSPGLGIWFASGETVSTAGAVLPQSNEHTSIGTIKPNTFTKGFACNISAVCPA